MSSVTGNVANWKKMLCFLAGIPLLAACENRRETSGELREKGGMEIVSLRVLSAGHLLELRYRVTDPRKADTAFGQNRDGLLFLEKTGTKLTTSSTPNLAPVSQIPKSPHPGQTYLMLFGNPSGDIRTGDLVTAELGGLKQPHVVAR